MSYQVLARKWRPQNFKQMVGQEHVLRALINALDSDRLHHAYLFTGTRGVGKTTIARILAKCLNCETGVTSTPCGECNSCQEIVAGNFLDLIEVDAASRTKVEDTRELLENVQYAPTRARFKVYLIDEVHMLTGHSFNALLKTLEEPPPHVKFLFATTDPQKLPATILSRCLQFNLKRMPVDMITGHLKYLLEEESINSEESSLKLLGRAADGSMRDALSLLDQAIAFSGSELTEASVRDMLGTISHEPLIDILNLILAGEGTTLLERVEDLSSVTPDFDATTDALISLLHQLAVQQVVPDAINDEDSIRDLASKMSKEEVQLFYQIALQGRKDLPLSPDPRSGFEMLLLRMMSFRPLREGMQLEASADTSKKKTTELETIQKASSSNEDTAEQPVEVTKSVEKPVVSHHTKVDIPDEVTEKAKKLSYTDEKESVPPWEEVPPPELETGYTSTPTQAVKPQEIKGTKAVDTDNKSQESTSLVDLLLAEDDVRELNQAEEEPVEKVANVDKNQPWYAVVPQLNLSGRANELIKHCVLEKEEKGVITLILDKDREDLLANNTKQEIHNAVANFYGDSTRFELKVAETETVVSVNKENETPAQRTDRKISETQLQAQQNIELDPFVLGLKGRFGAQVVPGSVKAKQILK